MMKLPQRFARWFGAMAAADAQVEQEVALGNMRRLRGLIPVFLVLNLLLLAVFVLGPVSPMSAIQQQWWQAVVQVYAGTTAWLVLVLLATWRIVRRTRVDRAVRVVQFVAPLSFLVFTVVLTALDQWITPNISPYLLGCMSVSLLFLLPPATTTWLFAITYGLYFVAIGLTQTDGSILLSNRANGFGATLLGLVLSLGLWRRNTQYLLLQRELTARNATLEKQQDELVWLATRDALTALYNRREFMRLAEEELRRAQRHGGFTSAIVVDLDHFKVINDRYGHPAGDKVLVHVAQCLLGGVRATDLVARIGGEEFMVLLPRTDIEAATQLADKLRRLLHAAPASIGRDLQIPVTASFGVGCLPAGGDGAIAPLYAAADKALYDAKRLGRNRVERVEPDASLTPSDFQRMRR
ncbi:MAG: GGDEF domain-containing protein [Rhodoferax sp.]|nr:GGDEF domain-containing protein [Rhodoferax sp.]MCW5627778.1 GGDEF domain-containing protein [Rhodoferax sp.]